MNSANFPALKRHGWVQTPLVLLDEHPILQSGGSERWGRTGGSQREDYLPCLGGLCHGGGFLPFPRYHFQAQLDRGQFWRNRRSSAAAMFEVDYYKYTMYDANNPKMLLTATLPVPTSLLPVKQIGGQVMVRYMEADRVLMKASATGGVTPQGIFNDLSRSFRNGMLDIDLRSGKFNRPQGSGWFVDPGFYSP